jgi:hypothetical protein
VAEKWDGSCRRRNSQDLGCLRPMCWHLKAGTRHEWIGADIAGKTAPLLGSRCLCSRLDSFQDAAGPETLWSSGRADSAGSQLLATP